MASYQLAQEIKIELDIVSYCSSVEERKHFLNDDDDDDCDDDNDDDERLTNRSRIGKVFCTPEKLLKKMFLKEEAEGRSEQ